jgi:hypothetical protein
MAEIPNWAVIAPNCSLQPVEIVLSVKPEAVQQVGAMVLMRAVTRKMTWKLFQARQAISGLKIQATERTLQHSALLGNAAYSEPSHWMANQPVDASVEVQLLEPSPRLMYPVFQTRPPCCEKHRQNVDVFFAVLFHNTNEQMTLGLENAFLIFFFSSHSLGRNLIQTNHR